MHHAEKHASTPTRGKKEESQYAPWIEKYRPQKLSDVVGQKTIVSRLKAFVKSKDMPHLLFVGRAGIGKSSCVVALAKELYADQVKQSLLELNASDERGIDVVRGKIKDFARTLPLSNVPFKLIFLDEADALTSEAQQALRRTMEKYSEKTRFVLAANYSSRIIEPIQSRCAVFRFAPLSEEEVIEIIDNIAKGEGLDLDNKAKKAVVYVADGDARKAANVMQGAHQTNDKITEEDVFKISSRARPTEISEMVKLARNGKFTDSRKLLDTLLAKYGMSGEEIILQIFYEVSKLDVDDDFKVNLIDKVGEFDFRVAEGARERIQLEALLAQLALNGKK